MRSPVLLIVFNRPEPTAKVFDAIRAARPPRLYVAADGAREGRAGEAERCAEVRRIATAVDWPCEVRTLLRERNLGCKRAVSGAIDWFFEQEPEGIVLEDDVLPLPSFFPYVEELLERYRDDTRVGLVSGCNLISHRAAEGDSYVFSRHPHIWGWASWRRAWRTFDVTMGEWPAWRHAGLAALAEGSWRLEHYWRYRFDAVHAGKIDTWDYQWVFALWRSGMLSITPARNLTTNLGFGADATHTTAEVPDFVRESLPRDLDFPLRHPARVERARSFDELVETHVLKLTAGWEAQRRLATLPVVGPVLRALRGAAMQG